MYESKYRLIGLGTAAEHKVDGRDWMLEVNNLELNNLADGAQTDTGFAFETTGTDHSGVAYSDKVLSSGTVPARWKGTGESNRRTCPNVVEGEELLLWTFADTNEIFWEPRNTNSQKRRLEEVAYAWAGDPAGAEELNDENSYVLNVSTQRGLILLSTSQKNSEASRFFIEINGMTGIMTAKDNFDNEINMSSLENRISMMTGEDLEVHLNGSDLQVKVPGNHTENTEGALNITVTGAANIQAASATIQSDDNKIIGPTTIDGTLKVTGMTTLNGANSPANITAPNIK